jgi:diguanylate cyclase (GGDEF)-like protein
MTLQPLRACRASLFVLALLLWLPLIAGAQSLRGMPLLRHFSPEDYNATPSFLSIATDKDGRLFVGNAEGVLRYDGETWTLIELPGQQTAREVVVGADGRIYVGGYDTFGWLQTSPDGETVYQELMTATGLKGKERNVGYVWQIIATDEGVYFRGETAMHFLSYDHQHVKHWPLGENQRSFYAQGNQLYARIAGMGFSRFVDGKFVLEPGGEMFRDRSLPGVLTRPGWRLLVGEDGLFRADSSGIRPLPENAAEELKGTHPYAVLPLSDGSFVVGSLRGDLFRFGADYKLRNHVTLGSFGITALGTDHEGGLWAATEGDLMRMSLPSPWSFIGAAQGLGGNVYDFEWYDGALWIAGTRGVVRMAPNEHGSVDYTETHWTDLEAYAVEGTDQGLVIGHRNGIMVLDKGATTPRELISTEAESVQEQVRSKLHPERIYALGDEHLFVLVLKDGKWQFDFSVPLEGASAAGLVETGPNEIWFGDSRGGPQRWTLDFAARKAVKREVFGDKQGIDLDVASGSSVFALDGEVHVISGKRGYRFRSPAFIPDAGPPFTLADRPQELVVEETPIGAYAFTHRQMWLRAPGKQEWKPIYLGSQLAAGYGQLRYNHDNVLRVSTWSGLLQYNSSEKAPPQAPLQLGFETVTAESADGQELRRLPLVSQGAPVEIPSGYRLHFRYGIVSMDSALEFRYRLNGGADLPDPWSAWTDRDLFVRAVTPGDYLLEVQARTRNGRVANPTSYRYRILPQWYENWWMRVLGVLALLGVIGLLVQEFVRRRTQRYIEANRKLEARIGERTHELEEVNRKLAELATEDALTGVSNRRALENGLQREWYRCHDQRRPLSALMIDVDHFKKYNDTHGHLEGDVLLRLIAKQLYQLHDPKRELLARYGGEEFALLLPGVHQDEAMRRAEKIRVALHEQLNEITISICVAGFVPTMQGDSANLLRRADAALYRAKRAGRNRVEVDTGEE